MRCYYEVLNVPRDADEAEIKSAYKKQALKWHPDKNLDNADEAKETFQLVQQAYEVLVDRQERAWYDNHREQILRGSDKEYEDNSLDVFKYFTSSCFKGYGDEDGGFYKVYGRVFEEIAKEDLEYMDDKEEFCGIPAFGTSTSDYESIVGPFYDYWMSYSTRKSYVWLDPYNVKETRDRKVLKLIEKENKKVRSKAKKERNDEVRELVAFVRKRDKRVQAYNKFREEKARRNKLKSAEISKQRRMERRKEINESSEQAEWTKFDNLESELEDIERSLAAEFGVDEDVSDDDENLYCIACNKLFKTPKAYENHESSKRHRENVERLREDMLNEESVDESESELIEEEPEPIKEEPELIKEEPELIKEESELIVEEPECTEELIEEEPEEKTRKKAKKKKKAALAAPKSDDEVKDLDPQIPVVEEPKKKTRKKKRTTVVPDDSENKQEEESKTRTKRRGKERTTLTSPKNDDADNCCKTCASKFESKNKLFTHLKSTGHGVHIPKSVKASGK